MDKRRTILIASDHNGNEARDHLVAVLSKKHNVIDMGPRTDEKSLIIRKVDYTDYAQQVAYAITKNDSLLGILICGTGVGMSIAANKFKGIKASLVTDVHTAKKTREHNDSNVLVMGAWNVTKDRMVDIANAWLGEEFGHGRHERRVARLDAHDENDVVLVPGVFEILHTGHIKLFEFAASLGRVVVALNSDASAERIKKRKMNVKQQDRMSVVKRIDCVDEVVLLDDDHPGELLKLVDARYIVKGGVVGDEERIRVHDHVPEDCDVKVYPLEHSWSSSQLREIFCGK